MSKDESPSYVKVWEESITIPTYRVGDPDRNPIFYDGRAYQGAKGPNYPYPLMDKLTDIREDKSYKAVFLENRYVRLCVLPEVGGRILSAEDKTNGYDFVYHQHVIKPALIGMLGTWISGGVEWNVPHHHRATTFMPVDHTIKENPDGSKTIWVGETELRHRMKWLIGLTLYPDKSYVEATVTIFNRTPFAHSMLYWANLSVHSGPDYQIIFPPRTEYATYHGKNQFSRWPISYEVFAGTDYTKGVDVSWWKNHPRPTSFFAWNYEDDFYAGYDHGKQAGTCHVADHHIVLGKKFFEWGNGAHGRMWDRILTETDGPYLELMTGAYSDNQPDYSWIQPYEVRTLKQYWYPLRQIEGVKNANLDAAVNLEITSHNTAKIALNTTSQRKCARLSLKTLETVIFEEDIDIGPEKPYTKEVALPADVKPEQLQVSLLSAADKELIAYKPVSKAGAPMPEPVKPPPPPKDVKTNEELYLTGLRLEQFHNPAFDPYPYYEEALKRDPLDYRVNVALGILYLKRGLYEQAEERLNRALERVTANFVTPKDGEAYYYLGVSLTSQGRYDDANDAFFKAAWNHAWHAASYHSLAMIECVKGDFLKAHEFINRSLSTNALNTKALTLKTMVLRHLGRLEEAEDLIQQILALDPLDFTARNELCLARSLRGRLDEGAEELKTLKEIMRDTPHSYLEVAVDYGNCGFYEEAVEVLSRLTDPDRKTKDVNPLIYYYLGYFYEKRGDMAQALRHYRLGSEAPSDYCFPFQLESIDVLQSAMKNNPRDARAPYYLGNLLYDIQPENAVKTWEKAASLDETFAVTHRNLGFAYARVENDLSKAIASLEKAVACNPKDPRFYLELDQLYEAAGQPPQKRLELLENNHEVVKTRDDALSREITLFVQMSRYDDAVALLSGHHFHAWEGATGIHDIYVHAHLLRGQEKLQNADYHGALEDYEAALEYPENLEVGGEWEGGGWAARIYFSIGTVYEALGNDAKAKEYYERTVAAKPPTSEMTYYQAQALQKLGREQEAEQMIDGLAKYATERLEASSGMDFFAKFGERRLKPVQTANAHYLIGLAYLGKGKQVEARTEFEEALKWNVYHIEAKKHLSNLKG